jgi:hypothetical protein
MVGSLAIDPSRMILVDKIDNNFVFSAGSITTADKTTIDINAMITAFRNLAFENGFRLPYKYELIDISLMN